MVEPKGVIRFNDVFQLLGASIYPAPARSKPVFEFAQSVVVKASAPLESLEQFSLLNRFWIDAVGLVYCQHKSSLPPQVIDGKWLFH
jgi:hypothetical protein